MSSDLLLILDDKSGQFNYSGGERTLSTLTQWYSQSSFYPKFAGSTDSTQFGSFSVTFEGTSIAFIGNTPQTVSPLSQLAAVTIDGGQPYSITYGDPDPPSYIQWYQSPTLADGPHTITVDGLAGTAVDFSLISVGSKTSLSGKTIFVDDDNPAIDYNGKWTRNTNKFIAGTLPHGHPAGNTTHRSSTPGDTITFRFSGGSPSVNGIFSWANLGILSATYSLDGNTVTNTLPVTTSTTEYVNNYGEASNVLMFSDNTIQPGDHTLVINITQCINQTFMLDYITYLPSFSSPPTMPNLTSIAIASTGMTQPTSTTQSITQPITQSVTYSITQSTTQSIIQSITQSITQSSTPSQINNGGNGMRTKTGIIIGVVAGGLTIIAILIFLLFCLRHRRRRGQENDSQTNLIPTQTQLVCVVPQTNQQRPLSSVPRRRCFPTIPFGMNSRQTLSPFYAGLPTHHGSGSAKDLKRKRADFEDQQRSRNIVSSRGNARYISSIRAELDTRNIVNSEPPSYDGLSR